MDFDLTEEQRAIKETARAFARAAMMPFARQGDKDEIFPVDTLREAAALGLGGIYVAADVGGSALSRLDAVLIFEELAQGCPSTAAYLSIHNIVAWMIDAYGSSELRQRFLPGLGSVPRPACEPRRRRRRGLQDRHERARWRAPQYRGLLARRRAVLPRAHYRVYEGAQAVRHPPRRFPGARGSRRRLCN